MKLGKIIWPAVLVCCIVIGVWQRHNISIFWREYHCLWRDFKYREHTLVPRRPIIPKSIARGDPEAAAVLDMYLQNCWGQDEKYLPDLVEDLRKFPDNEFFLLLGVNEIFRANELDQKIGLKLSERLIELDKDNSLYHYLKTVSLLSNQQNGDIAPVLDEIKAAGTCHNFYFPETKYTKRFIAMAERASLYPEIVEELSYPLSFAPSVRQIHKFLLRYANGAFTDGEPKKGLLIDDAINGIGRNQFEINNYEVRGIRNSRSISSPFGYLSCPEVLELQRAKITEQRAKQDRIQLCPPVPQQIKTEEARENEDSGSNKKPEVTIDELIIAMPVAVYNGRMFVVIAEIWLALVAISMVRGWSGNQRIGMAAILSFATASLCYFFVINGKIFDEVGEMCHCCFSYRDVMRPVPNNWAFVGSQEFNLVLLLIVPILTALLIWATSRPYQMPFWRKMLLKLILAIVASAIIATTFGLFRHFANEWLDLPEGSHVFVFVSILTLPVVLFSSQLSRLRLIRVVLAAIPLGVLTILAGPYAYISQILMILFVAICTLIILNKPSEPIPFGKVLTGIFSRQPELVTIRSRAVKLLAVFLVIHWLIFTASVPTCAEYIEQIHSGNPWSYPKLKFAPADEARYQQMLAKFDSNDFTLDKFHKLIPLVMPQDLPLVLSKCKEKDFDSSYPWRLSAEQKDVYTPSENRQEIKLRAWDIINVMSWCGRDVVNILVDNIENPERESVLVIRAKLGDVRVKVKLEELLASRLANGEAPGPNEWYEYWDEPAKTIGIICGLACISEPNEAGARFMDYVARSDMSRLIRNDEFFRGIPLLPTTQAREVLKAYLAKAQDWQTPECITSNGEKYRVDLRETLSPIAEMIGAYDDRDISEAVFKINLRSEDEGIIRDWDGPWEIPQDFDVHSADLLRQGLASKNEQLRAWCVWQLRKVGYQFSEEEETGLLADESWKVRANAVISGGPKTAGRAAKDPNPFVRWVASLSTGE